MVKPFNVTEENRGRDLVLPTAPPLLEGDELSNMYVDFLILGNKENYVVRGERKAISDSNTQLSHIINGTVSTQVTDGKFVIRDVDKDNFDLFIRYLETKSIKFSSSTQMLRVLEIASRFQCRQLEIHCVKEIDEVLSKECVFEVFRALWYYNSITPPRQPVNAGKRKKKERKDPLTPEEYFSALLNNCLQLIDMNAEDVLTQEQMLLLRFEELEMIVKRDALQISSETVLCDLLSKWSFEECKRKHMDINGENRRRVLGALCYTPRFLTMSFKDFESVKERLEILDNGETNLVSEVLGGKKQSNLTPEQTTMISNFKKPRPQFTSLPIHLSNRSNPKNYPKKMRKAAEKEDYDDENKGCNKCLLNFLTFISCICD